MGDRSRDAVLMRGPLTPAARGTRKATPEGPSAPAKASRSTGHRSSVGRATAPRSPRRVSGPASGIARAAVATAGALAPALPATRPAWPSTRPSRPVTRPRRAPREAGKRARSADRRSLPARAVAVVRALPDHALLDRVIRGRVWIPLLGVLLAGIVAMQVEVLKLNAGIGRSLEKSTTLQDRNQLLRASVAKLADDQRIESLAAKRGMFMPAPSAVHFVAAGRANDQRATANIHAPDPTTFTANLPAADTTAGAGGTSQSAGATVPGGSAITTTPAATGASTTGATPAISTTGGAATASSAPATSTATAPGTTATPAGTTAAGTTATGTPGAPTTATGATATSTPGPATTATGATAPSTGTPAGSATPTAPAGASASGGGGLVAAGAATGATSTGG